MFENILVSIMAIIALGGGILAWRTECCGEDVDEDCKQK